MSNLSEKADGSGKIDINGKISPAPYKIYLRQEDGRPLQVEVRFSAPRDWLLERGFKSQATLISANGARLELHHEGELDATDNLSVELSGTDDSCETRGAVDQKYPELRAI
jgi:hypothetical protein